MILKGIARAGGAPKALTPVMSQWQLKNVTKPCGCEGGDQEAIPNLYAAGEVIGGHQGDVYMGGCLFAYAICSGHNAGAAAVAAIAE